MAVGARELDVGRRPRGHRVVDVDDKVVGEEPPGGHHRVEREALVLVRQDEHEALGLKVEALDHLARDDAAAALFVEVEQRHGLARHGQRAVGLVAVHLRITKERGQFCKACACMCVCV